MNTLTRFLIICLPILFLLTDCKKEEEPKPEPKVIISIPDSIFLKVLLEKGITL